MGGDALDLALVLETAGMHYLDLATMIFRNVCYGVDALLESGTDAQKQDFIPATIQGAKYFAFSLTEPDAGSDAAAIIARADREEDRFRLTGTKNFTSGMPTATHISSSPLERTTRAPSTKASRTSSSPPTPRASPGRSSTCSATGRWARAWCIMTPWRPASTMFWEKWETAGRASWRISLPSAYASPLRVRARRRRLWSWP